MDIRQAKEPAHGYEVRQRLVDALGPAGQALDPGQEGGDLPPVDVPGTTLLAIAAAVPVVFAALVSLPALRRAQQPPALALSYE